MKKLTGFAVAAVLVLAAYGCGGSEQESSSSSAESIESENGSAANVSEEAYIDVVAHQQVLTTKYTENADPSQMQKAVEKIDSEMDKVLDKYDVTLDDINAYAERYEDDPEAYMETMEKLSSRIDELSEEYGVE